MGIVDVFSIAGQPVLVIDQVDASIGVHVGFDVIGTVALAHAECGHEGCEIVTVDVTILVDIAGAIATDPRSGSDDRNRKRPCGRAEETDRDVAITIGRSVGVKAKVVERRPTKGVGVDVLCEGLRRPGD